MEISVKAEGLILVKY